MSAKTSLPSVAMSASNANINPSGYDSRAVVANANGGAYIGPNGRPVSGSYFPYQQPQPQHPPQRALIDDETLSNTLANSHIAPPPEDLHRQPKFTEEWDASARGSSIVEGPTAYQHLLNHQPRTQSPSMQRASSISSRSELVTGDAASAHGISLSRGNTLKKKQSLRRSGSLKRSSSRRSMKAGSVRSLALQSSHDSDEIHSIFYCPVPTSGNPTEILANRFHGRSPSQHLLSTLRRRGPGRALTGPLTFVSRSLEKDPQRPHRLF